jgi:hypothetical protein
MHCEDRNLYRAFVVKSEKRHNLPNVGLSAMLILKYDLQK